MSRVALEEVSLFDNDDESTRPASLSTVVGTFVLDGQSLPYKNGHGGACVKHCYIKHEKNNSYRTLVLYLTESYMEVYSRIVLNGGYDSTTTKSCIISREHWTKATFSTRLHELFDKETK